MRLFNQGPWRTFGVTRDEVQMALKQGTDQKTIVDGALEAVSQLFFLCIYTSIGVCMKLDITLLYIILYLVL